MGGSACLAQTLHFFWGRCWGGACLSRVRLRLSPSVLITAQAAGHWGWKGISEAVLPGTQLTHIPLGQRRGQLLCLSQALPFSAPSCCVSVRCCALLRASLWLLLLGIFAGCKRFTVWSLTSSTIWVSSALRFPRNPSDLLSWLL